MTRLFDHMPWGLRDIIQRKGQSNPLMVTTIYFNGKYVARPKEPVPGWPKEGTIIYPSDYHLYETIQSNRS